MIETWAADITPLLEEKEYYRYYAQLPEWRKAKAEALRQPSLRAQSVGAGILLERMKETYKLSEKLKYNLSHSGIYALCSVVVPEERGIPESLAGQREGENSVSLGCDVEMIGELREGVARRFFTQAEQESVFSQVTRRQQTEMFYRYWVLKESFIKATGKGMGLDLRSFEIQMEEDKPVLSKKPGEYREVYYYQEYEVPEKDAKIAVCSTDGKFGELHMEVFAMGANKIVD